MKPSDQAGSKGIREMSAEEFAALVFRQLTNPNRMRIIHELGRRLDLLSTMKADLDAAGIGMPPLSTLERTELEELRADAERLASVSQPEPTPEPLTLGCLESLKGEKDTPEPQASGGSPPQSKCANCNSLLAVDGWTEGLEEGEDSKAANLECGHRYCWHCSDNRGRHEDCELGECGESAGSEQKKAGMASVGASLTTPPLSNEHSPINPAEAAPAEPPAPTPWPGANPNKWNPPHWREVATGPSPALGVRELAKVLRDAWNTGDKGTWVNVAEAALKALKPAGVLPSEWVSGAVELLDKALLGKIDAEWHDRAIVLLSETPERPDSEREGHK